MKKRKIEGCDYVFPGPRGGMLSDVSINKTLHAFEPEVTVHGFRSSFSDWRGEVTTFPRELAEMALAHTVGDETERAYRRGDALAKRRKLMDAWASYIARKSNVFRLAQAG
jgi:integrase